MVEEKIILLNNIKSDVFMLLENEYSGHDFLHVLRVFDYANLLQKLYGGDEFIISLAALLHDADDKKLFPETYENKTNAISIMNKYKIEASICDEVIKIISCISFSEGKIPNTIEGKIVQDADRIDAIGAIGIARCFSFGGSNKRPIYKIDDFDRENIFVSDSSLAHFFNKLLSVCDKMNTDYAKIDAIRRTEFLKEYLTQLFSEINLNIDNKRILELLDLN